MIRRLFAIARDERGLTLPELIVASMLTVVVLITVGGMYLSTLRVERVVDDLTSGASSAQLVARSVDAGVRNGVFFAPTPVVTDGTGMQLLVACTAGSASTASYSWQAWVYDPAGDGQLRTRTFAANAAPTMPTTATIQSWSLLATGIDPLGASDTVFGYDASVDPRRVSIDFASTGDLTDSATIHFETNLAPAPTYASGSEPCT